MSHKEMSKSVNDKKSNFIVESDAIDLSNVFTLQKVELDHQKQEDKGGLTSTDTVKND